MGIIRLSLITVVGLGVALNYFGRDEGLPDTSLGRETSLASAVDLDSLLTGTTDSDIDSALAAALASDASPDTASLITPARAAAPDEPLPAMDEPVAEVIQASVETTTPAIEPPAASAPTLLYVTGSRVNVRGGPSTDFGVIAALGAGTRVEDVSDAGSGWREIRILETGETGFMSGSFLSANPPG